MPSFKFQAQQRLPGAGGHKLAQARGIQAPQLRAPQQQTVLRGRTVQKQFVAERRSPESFALTDSMQKLGNLFLAKAVKQADEQTTLAASSAISKYRRAVSDAYYSEEGGLWSKTGAEGSTVFNDNKENINALRDGFAEGLDANAKRKYLVSVAGIHNQNLDQLAKKQFNNISQYRQEIRAATEGDDAESMHGFLREQDEFGMSTPNVDAIINTINDTPLGLTEAEAQARKDRMVFSMVQSADALDVNAESMGNLMDAVKHLASQELQNKLAEGLEKYALAEEKQIAFNERQVEVNKAKANIEQDKDFVELEHNGRLTPQVVMDSDLSATRQSYWLAKLEKGVTVVPDLRPEYSNLKDQAIAATLDIHTVDIAIELRHIDGKEGAALLANNNKWKKLRNGEGNDLSLALKAAEQYRQKGVYSKNDKKNIDAHYDMVEALHNLPDGQSPMDYLRKTVEPAEKSWFGEWADGFMGNERLEDIPVPDVITPDIEKIMRLIDIDTFKKQGVSVYTEKSRDEVAQIAIGYMRGQARALNEIDYNLGEASAVQFDPDGTGYDYDSARAAGLSADDTGHWPSRNPDTGQILKGKGHETFNLTVEGEEKAGYKIEKGADGKYYSQQSITPNEAESTLEGAKPMVVATLEEIKSRQGKIKQSEANEMVLDALNVAGEGYSKWKEELAAATNKAFLNTSDSVNIFEWVDGWFRKIAGKVTADYERNKELRQN